jgi:hypothetical protein
MLEFMASSGPPNFKPRMTMHEAVRVAPVGQTKGMLQVKKKFFRMANLETFTFSLDRPGDFLELASIHQVVAALDSKLFIGKCLQIHQYDWMAPSTAMECVDRLRTRVVGYETATYERVLTPQQLNWREHGQRIIEGCVDIETSDAIWEIKCVANGLASEHFLQLAVYAWLYRRSEVRHTFDRHA